MASHARPRIAIRFRLGPRMKSHLPLALLALLACEGPFVPPPLGPPPPPTVASVQLAPDSATIVAGDTLALIVTLRDSSGAALTGRTVAGRGLACWGKTHQGQLGRGGAPGTPSLPAPVATPLRFTALAAGASHTCGLTADGGTYCWGLDFAGQLGDGGTTFRDTPRRAISDVAFATLVAGANHTCALAAGGGAYCWGANALGQLGDSTRANRGTPVPVAGGLSFARLSAGGAHACALTAAGAAYGWGGNIAGQLGTGTADPLEATPQPVTGGLSFRGIATGGAHTCRLTADSLAYCWGNDSDGELGDSAMTTQPIATPVLVRGGLRFADLHAGASHTCGITGTRLVYCWGSGRQGQLGQLFPHSRAVPLRVAGQP